MIGWMLACRVDFLSDYNMKDLLICCILRPVNLYTIVYSVGINVPVRGRGGDWVRPIAVCVRDRTGRNGNLSLSWVLRTN